MTVAVLDGSLNSLVGMGYILVEFAVPIKSPGGLTTFSMEPKTLINEGEVSSNGSIGDTVDRSPHIGIRYHLEVSHGLFHR